MSNLPPPPPPGGTPPPPPPPGGDPLPPPGSYTPPPAGGYVPPAADYGAPPAGAYGAPGYGAVVPGVPPGYQQKEKMVAGLLGILIGGFGVHNFYLGYTTKGIIQIVVTIVTCGIGAIWGLIEGIMILTGSINTDANGVPLKG
jgi:TM2 domain-containing membrane protein YozV